MGVILECGVEYRKAVKGLCNVSEELGDLQLSQGL